MKKRLQKLCALLMAVSILCTGVFSMEANAASGVSYMRSADVLWGIRAGQSYTFDCAYNGLGVKENAVSWKISNPHDTKAVKKGYRKMVFDLEGGYVFAPTPEEVDAITTAEPYDGGFWFFVVDGYTGKNLCVDNPYGVTVTVIQKDEKKTSYAGTHENSIDVPEQKSYRIRIVYPKDYKNACIGFGGTHSTKLTANDRKFIRGKVSFKKADIYKKNKNNSRWVRAINLH